MKRPVSLTFVLVLLVAVVALALAQPPAGGPPPGARPQAPAPFPGDTAVRMRDSLMNVVLQQIAGRDTLPAESVFKNIQVLKGMPAGRLVRIMNFGDGRALGVGCDHCHVLGQWDKDDKRPKLAARDMVKMMSAINDTLLRRMTHLESERPFVNCGTCHQGKPRPNARPAGGGAPGAPSQNPPPGVSGLGAGR